MISLLFIASSSSLGAEEKKDLGAIEEAFKQMRRDPNFCAMEVSQIIYDTPEKIILARVQWMERNPDTGAWDPPPATFAELIDRDRRQKADLEKRGGEFKSMIEYRFELSSSSPEDAANAIRHALASAHALLEKRHPLFPAQVNYDPGIRIYFNEYTDSAVMILSSSLFFPVMVRMGRNAASPMSRRAFLRLFAGSTAAGSAAAASVHFRGQTRMENSIRNQLNVWLADYVAFESEVNSQLSSNQTRHHEVQGRFRQSIPSHNISAGQREELFLEFFWRDNLPVLAVEFAHTATMTAE